MDARVAALLTVSPSLTVLDSTLVLSRPSLSSSSSSSLNSAAAFSMNLKTSSTALVSETSGFLQRRYTK